MKRGIIFAIIIISLTTLVLGVTLTKEFTDKVVIHTAIAGELCKEQDCGRFIGGLADVYPKEGEPVDYFIIFSFKDQLYRGITTNFIYKNETLADELTGLMGKCSLLDSTAEFGERVIDCRYFVSFEGNRITNIELNLDSYEEGPATTGRYSPEQRAAWPFIQEIGGFPHVTDNYHLSLIEDSVSNIIWYPGEETLE